MNLMGIPDQLDSNYGESDAPAIRHPGTMRAVPNASEAMMNNPYSQYGKAPSVARPNSTKQAEPYPLQEIEGYEMQMIHGTPNAAPFANAQISPTPFNRGDFVPVYNVGGKPYNWSDGPTYGNPYGFADWFNNLWAQDVPAAPIGKESPPAAHMALANALVFVGVMQAPSDKWADIEAVLRHVQQTTKIPVTGTYDAATQNALAKAFTAKRQGKALTEVWSQIEASGVLPEWWNTTTPTTDIVEVGNDTSDSDSNLLKYGLIAVAVLGVMVGVGFYVNSKRKEV